MPGDVRLRDDPERFFTEICAFIGVAPVRPDPRPVNRGPAMTMPPEVRAYLRAIWLPEIEKLCREEYAPYPQRWLEAHLASGAGASTGGSPHA